MWQNEVYESDDYISRDTGCSVFPRCLICPFPKCLYEVRGGFASLRKENRIRETRALIRQGMNTTEVALVLGMSNRTVERYLKRSQESCRG